MTGRRLLNVQTALGLLAVAAVGASLWSLRYFSRYQPFADLAGGGGGPSGFGLVVQDATITARTTTATVTVGTRRDAKRRLKLIRVVVPTGLAVGLARLALRRHQTAIRPGRLGWGGSPAPPPRRGIRRAARYHAYAPALCSQLSLDSPITGRDDRGIGGSKLRS